MIWQALTLQAGYNAALVTLGAAALGAAAGAVGAFLYLRKRSLVSDAISHATLPGLALAFMIMVALGGEGRSLVGLMLGSALSAGLGLWLLKRMTQHTRLPEDAGIGAVLSVFFGAGIVLLTVIQSLSAGRQAGLEGFLLGSTAGMLQADALTIGIGGMLVLVGLYALRRPLLITAFDEGFAQVAGVPARMADAALMMVALLVTVIGLRIVGLVLIVALLIIPAAAGRFWTQSAPRMVLIAAGFGAVSGYVGAAFSASAAGLPTGPVIVLVAFSLFVVSAVAAPARGVTATLWAQARLRGNLRLQQALRAFPGGDRTGHMRLRRAGFVDEAGLTALGEAELRSLALDEQRWRALRARGDRPELIALDTGAVRVADLVSAEQLRALDERPA